MTSAERVTTVLRERERARAEREEALVAIGLIVANLALVVAIVREAVMRSKLTDKQKLRLALRALKLADGVMEYCAGDAWERECTAADRKKFEEIYDQLVGRA